MRVVNFSEARNNLKSLCDAAYHDSEEIIINRKNGENVVIISLEEYNALQETAYLLKSPKNKEHLMRSLAHAREGKVEKKELIDL